MTDLTLDIETIPSQTPGALEAIAATITAPGNYKKQESIDAWLDANATKEAENVWLKTSFDGAQGECCCIGFSIADHPAVSISRDLDGSEADMLQNFYDSLTDENYLKIGHNVKDFDLRFLFQRSVILGVKPSIDLGIGNRYDKNVYDTMQEWAGWNKRISLVNLCAALGIKAKEGDLGGSKVWDYVRSGRIAEVATYCESDVENTRKAFKRMTFA